MKIRNIYLLYLLVLPYGGDALSGTVYSWVDAAGTTHFSQSPPASPDTQATTIDVPDADSYAPPSDDYFSVINQATRMEQARLLRERVHAEQLRAEAELRARTGAPVPSAPPEAMQESRYHILWYPPHRVYRHEHHHGDPEHRPPRPASPAGPPRPINPLPPGRFPGYSPAPDRPGLIHWSR